MGSPGSNRHWGRGPAEGWHGIAPSQGHSTRIAVPTLAPAPAGPTSFTWAPNPRDTVLCREKPAPVKPRQPKDRMSEECDKD